MASSSWNQQALSARENSRPLYKSDCVYELRDSSLLELSEFRNYFFATHHRAIDIVVIYQVETNNPYGFGFVANDESSTTTGGTFRTDLETATALRNKLLQLATELSNIHTSSQPQRHMGERLIRKDVNYVQFPTPSLLLEHQFSNYFNVFPACSFSVALLFDKRACGFGFLQNPPSNSYMNHLKWMVEGLKVTIYGGLTSISRSFLGQGVGSSVQQQQRGEGGRGSAATEVAEIHGSYLGQGVTGSWMAHTVQQQQQQQRGERGRGSATAIMGQPLIGSFSGGEPNPTQWPGRENVAWQSYSVMQQQPPQFAFHSQETTRVFPHEAINRPSSAPMWRGPSAGVTSQVLRVRPAGQQETNQWSGSTYGTGFFNTVMQHQHPPGPFIHSQTMNTISGSSFRATEQLYSGSFSGAVGTNRPVQNREVRVQSYAVVQQQQPQPSLHSQATDGVFPHEALNRPASDHMWSSTSAGVTHQVLSARPAGQLETNQWYGGGYYNTMMQQPGPSNTQTTNTTSGSSFGATGQLFSGSFAGGQQQQLQQRGERGRGSTETEIQRVWVPQLTHTSTMNLRDFNQYFYNLIQPAIDKSAIDMVIIYNNDNTQCGFGFVVNETSIQSGGHFRTVPYWEDRLKINIAVISDTLKDKHCTGQALNSGLESHTTPINYAQLQSPLISSLLQQRQIAGFFKNLNPSDDFQVVALLPGQPCGFGFIQVPHIVFASTDRRKYLDDLRPLVHQLMITIDGGITAICSSTITPPAAVRPLSVPLSGSYSSSVDGVMQHQLRSKSAAEVVPYEETSTPSESRNEAVMQQQQHPDSFIHSRAAGAKRPGQNGNT